MATPGRKLKWANGQTEGPAGPGLEEVKTLQQHTGPKGALENVPALDKPKPELKSGSPSVVVKPVDPVVAQKTLNNAHAAAELIHNEIKNEPILPPGEARAASAKAAAEAKKKLTTNPTPDAPKPNVIIANPLSNSTLPKTPTPPKTRKRKPNNKNGTITNGKLLTSANAKTSLEKLSGLPPNNNGNTEFPSPPLQLQLQSSKNTLEKLSGLPPNNNGVNRENLHLNLDDNLCTLLRVGIDSISEYIIIELIVSTCNVSELIELAFREYVERLLTNILDIYRVSKNNPEVLI
jgi:hypothetical protein